MVPEEPKRNPNGAGFNDLPPARALMTLRIIWFALFMGQAMFFAVLVLAILPHQKPPEHPNPIFMWTSIIFFMTSVPATFVIRRMTFNRSRGEDGAIAPGAYATGNIVFWAGCEGASLFAMVAMMVNGSIWPTILIAAAAIALQVLTFPTGAATKPPFDAFSS